MRCYVYLSHRDKKGIKLLGLVNSQQQLYQKINVEVLQLPKDLQKTIAKVVYDARMKWDLWIESAETYADLEKRLKNRGFTELPRFSLPAYNFTIKEFTNRLT